MAGSVRRGTWEIFSKVDPPPIGSLLALLFYADPTCNAVTQALRNVPHLGPKVSTLFLRWNSDRIVSGDASNEIPRVLTVFLFLQNLPSMLVLTDIADIPNTVGLFRIAIVFEGRVPLLNTKGQLVDRTGHRLPDAAARELYSNLHRLRQG